MGMGAVAVASADAAAVHPDAVRTIVSIKAGVLGRSGLRQFLSQIVQGKWCDVGYAVVRAEIVLHHPFRIGFGVRVCQW